MKSNILFSFVFLFLSINQQAQFVEHVITNGFNVGDIASIDYDHDGDDDLLLSAYNGVMISLFDGENYEAPIVLTDGVNFPEIEIIDLDNDGNDDIFLNSQDMGAIISGTTSSIPATLNYTEGVSSESFEYGLFLAHINSDNLLDLVHVSNADLMFPYDMNVSYNLGNMAFDEAITTETLAMESDGAISQFYFTDMDFDGDDDIIVRSWIDEINWLENDGTGAFETEHVLLQDANLWPYAYDGIKNLFKGDFNGDGNADIMLTVAYQGSVSSSYPNTALCFLGNGSEYIYNNMFQTNMYAPYSKGNELSDVNGDGNVDLPAAVATNYVTIDSQSYHTLTIGYFNSVLENTGELTEISSNETTTDLLRDFVYANDELLIGAGEVGCRVQRVLANGIAGMYEELVSAPVQCIGDVVDYDLDNDLDILIRGVGDDYAAFRLLYNDGDGNFDTPLQSVFDPSYNPGGSYHFADVNQDGLLDCVHTYVSDANMYEMNIQVDTQNEDHTFTTSYTSSTFIHDSSFGDLRINECDFDNNGLMDFAVVIVDMFLGDPTILYTWTSVGDGQFVETLYEFPMDAVFYNDASAWSKDMNGDDLMDLIISDDSNMPVVLLGDGDGNFEVPEFLNWNWYDNTVVLDYDLDGILDVLGHDGSSANNWQLCLGTIDGEFGAGEPMTDITYNEYSEWPAMVDDFNQDGMEDFIFLSHLFLRGQDGSFLPEINLFEAGYLYGCSFANVTAYDMNSDGFPDLLNNTSSQQVKWFENLYGSPYSIGVKAYMDENGNSIQDANENLINNFKIHVDQNSAVYTSDLGVYQFPVLEGTHDLEAQYDNTLWILNNASMVVDVTASNPVVEVVYALQPTSPVLDVEIVAISDFPLCSFNSQNWVEVTNTGNLVQSGDILVSFDELITGMVYSPQPDQITAEGAQWHYENLAPFEQFQIAIEAQMPNFTWMGEMMEMNATVTAMNDQAGQTMVSEDSYSEALGCSYDPNDKRELNGLGAEGWIEQNQTLRYLVRFQNTGNAAAQTVVLKDQLSTHVDWLSLRPISSSHNMLSNVDENGLATFTFNNIMLPDSTSDEPSSHGYVLFEIDQLQDVPHLTVIDNTVEIYFDLNPAVITNTCSNTIYNCAEFNTTITNDNGTLTSSLVGPIMTWTLNNEIIPEEDGAQIVALLPGNYAVQIQFGETCIVQSSIEVVGISENDGMTFSAFPNPADENIRIQFENKDKRTITLYDTHGKQAMRTESQLQQIDLDVRSLASGVYHLTVFSKEKNEMSGVDIVLE
jgi:uncharacterized repeat protein (TIGR01451 family)